MKRSTSFEVPKSLFPGTTGKKINKRIHSVSAKDNVNFAIDDKGQIQSLMAQHEIVCINAQTLKGFFLPIIVTRAKLLRKNQILLIKQNFEPIPLYSILGKMGFMHYSEKIRDDLFHIYFVRKKEIKKNID